MPPSLAVLAQCRRLGTLPEDATAEHVTLNQRVVTCCRLDPVAIDPQIQIGAAYPFAIAADHQAVFSGKFK
jgi:hypothetical protein